MNRRSFISRALAGIVGALVAPFVPARRFVRPSKVEVEYLREIETEFMFSDEFNSEPECLAGPPWDVNCACKPCVDHYRRIRTFNFYRWMIHRPGESVAAGTLVYLHSDGYITAEPPEGAYIEGVLTGKTKDNTAEIRFS